MRYQDKSLEETRTVVETYIENHKKRTGREPDPALLVVKLEELARKMEEDAFQSAFEGQTINTILNAIVAVKEVIEPKPVKIEKTENGNTWHKHKGNGKGFKG